MAEEEILWLTESDVVQQVTLNETIDALEDILREEANGAAVNVPKALATWEPSASLHALGSVSTAKGLCGFKTWINNPNGAMAAFILFDGEAGRVLAVIEAFALGQLRTAGIAGLAAKWLSMEDSACFALLGSGRQALLQAASVAAVRPLTEIRVMSRDDDRRAAIATKLEQVFNARIIPCKTVREATDGASIVTAVTRAKTPFIAASDLDPGTHFMAMGAVLPANAEFEPELLDRVGPIIVDNIENAKRNSKELITYLGGRDSAAWDERVVSLGARIQANATPASDSDISFFKGMGMGLSDLAVAMRVYEKAKQSGAGVRLAKPQAASPRWTPFNPGPTDLTSNLGGE